MQCTILRSSFILSLQTISAQSAPGATKTIAYAPLSALMALDTTTGTTTRSLLVRYDSTAPYSASPNELFSYRVRSSGTGEGKPDRLNFCACASLPLDFVGILARKTIPVSIDALVEMFVPTKTSVLALTVTHRKFVVSKNRMTNLLVLNSRQ
jgi:hypothetical protein